MAKIDITRRGFIKTGAAASIVTSALARPTSSFASEKAGTPIIICSRGDGWGQKVLEPAWKKWLDTGNMLDTVEAGANVVELDPNDQSVGYGGFPNEEGIVELDASIMSGPDMNCGSVAGMRNIAKASSVARLVMERTGHIMIVGKGATKFAIKHGFKKQNLLTEKSRIAWLRWKENMSERDGWLPPKDNDYSNEGTTGTINVLGIDGNGDVFGITTTSGLSWKIPGRVGDSPIIGAGLYLDNNVGAVGATGLGEQVIKTCTSFLAVEKMREGMSPTEACVFSCKRIIEVNKGQVDFNVKFVAVNKDGEVGSAQLKQWGETHCSYITSSGFKAIKAEYVKS
jgi:N4-(beta-N-acetylglucosaminyl)-L-asparaginase